MGGGEGGVEENEKKTLTKEISRRAELLRLVSLILINEDGVFLLPGAPVIHYMLSHRPWCLSFLMLLSLILFCPLSLSLCLALFLSLAL